MTLLVLFSQSPLVTMNPSNATVSVEPDGPIDEGDLVRLRITFTDPDTGVVVDPGAVSFRSRSPYGTTAPAAVLRVATGVYEAVVVADMAGTWSYQFTAVSPYAGRWERRFTVQPSVF